LTTSLDEQTAIGEQLRSELSRLGKNVDQLLSEKGTLKESLDEAKTRLDELRKAEAAADARAQLIRELAARFKKMTDSGQLSIVVRSGRIILQLPNDVLFDSGQADLKSDGFPMLGKVAEVLRGMRSRHFQVAGHTDDVPIRSSHYRSNWELSTARAMAVVRLLVDRGVAPQSLSGAGYAEFDPVVPNASPSDRAKNRRIEISFVPLVDEFPPPPNAAAGHAAQGKS
jgi:chemotaxis protein MotB